MPLVAYVIGLANVVVARAALFANLRLQRVAHMHARGVGRALELHVIKLNLPSNRHGAGRIIRLLLTIAAIGFGDHVEFFEIFSHRERVARFAFNGRGARRCVARGSLIPLPRNMRIGAHIGGARFGGGGDGRANLNLARRGGHGNVRNVDGARRRDDCAGGVGKRRSAYLRRDRALDIFSAQLIAELKRLGGGARYVGISAGFGIAALPLVIQLRSVDENPRSGAFLPGARFGDIPHREHACVVFGIDDGNGVELNLAFERGRRRIGSLLACKRNREIVGRACRLLGFGLAGRRALRIAARGRGGRFFYLARVCVRIIANRRIAFARRIGRVFVRRTFKRARRRSGLACHLGLAGRQRARRRHGHSKHDGHECRQHALP